MPDVDVVVVSYNSRGSLRGCVEPLTRVSGITVVVVDNDSTDESLDTVANLPVVAIRQPRNGGFSYGCNAGWRHGSAPYVLFLNPDARIDGRSLATLVAALADDPGAGAVGPLIRDLDGELEFSQRRFPRLTSTYAQALFLHRLLPSARWTDEMVRAREAYERAGVADWLSGACLLVRRSLLEQLGGFDERFFLYSEDKDLCRRIWNAGSRVLFEPDAVCRHEGGASAPQGRVTPLLAVSRVRYAQKHDPAPVALLMRLGVALGSLTHALLSVRGRAVRAGYARAFAAAVLPGAPGYPNG